MATFRSSDPLGRARPTYHCHALDIQKWSRNLSVRPIGDAQVCLLLPRRRPVATAAVRAVPVRMRVTSMTSQHSRPSRQA
jgi:hypothetical protein